METLAFYFPVVKAHSTVLNFRWGPTINPISLIVNR